jgi:predicted Zn-dependent protease
LAEASEMEIHRALAKSWRFVSGPRSSEYLDRLARSTARTLDGAAEGCRVLLVDDPAVLRLALPSGLLLLSVGALGVIEDEAELVFVLGHELAHVASGDAARRLVALGLVELTRGEGGHDEAGWLRAANDLLRLGHGPENEHEADLQGVRAVLALGYEPESVIRYLERMDRAVDKDDLRVAETTLAHPLPGDRLLRVRKSWGVHVRDPGASRVNRDAFRRAVGHSALVAELEAADPLGMQEPSGLSGRLVPWKDWRLVGTGVAILLLATLFLVLGLALAR